VKELLARGNLVAAQLLPPSNYFETAHHISAFLLLSRADEVLE